MRQVLGMGLVSGICLNTVQWQNGKMQLLQREHEITSYSTADLIDTVVNLGHHRV